MAATSVLKLKVEDKEYNASLRQAQQGMQHLEQALQAAGKTFNQVDKSVVEYARGIGQMEAQSKTARGRIGEMTSAFVELSTQYNKMSADVQNSDVGKALSQSIEQLRQRTIAAKQELDSATSSLNDNGEAGKGTSGILEVLKDKFTVNIDALTLFNKGLQAAEVALNVAKDAFFASEATVDEWGRIVDSSKSLYEGFLTALNTGDISGYLGRIDEIVQAARTAYNELDRLGTMKTIQGPKMSAQQTENERMRMMIQTGRYIAPVDGRRASMKDGQLLTPEQIRGLETKLQNGMKTVVSLVGNEVKQTGKAIDAVYNRQAKELGLSLSEFRKGTSSMAEFDKRMAGYEKYKQWDARAQTEFARQGGRGYVNFDASNPYASFRKWGTFRVDGERYKQLVQLIQQRDQQAGQAYSMQSQAYRTMNRAEGITVSKLMKGETAGGATGGNTTTHAATPKTEEQQNTSRIAELVKQYQDLATAAKTADDAQKAGLTERMAKIQGEIKILQDRNAELKKFADEAKQVQFPVGSLPQLNEQLKTLQTEQAKALDAKQWHDYQSQIEQTQYQIEALKGKWKDGLQATFKADDADVLAKVRDIEGITIDDKTLTVTANTAEAYNKVQELLKSVDGKTVTFTVQPKMETGTSIQNDAGMSAYIASLKQQLETADYGTSLYNGLSAQLADMTALQNLVGESLKAGLGTAMFDAADATGKDFWTRAMEGSVEDTDWQAIVEKINEALKAAGLDTIKIDTKTGKLSSGNKKDEVSLTGEISKMAGGIASMTSGLEQLGADIPEGMKNVVNGIQGIISILSAINTIVTAIQAISAADTLIPFSTGGIVRAAAGYVVPGNFGYDAVPSLLTSGEVVLNRAQQGNLASQLQYGDGQRGETLARVSGETIYIAVNNYLRRTGQGELVTWR